MRNIIRKDNKMARYRQGRINGEITREMTPIVRDVKDPRVSDAMICITGADCSADLKFCKIYYSTLLTGDDAKEVARGLRSASGFIRGQLAKRLNMRNTPELTFVLDTSVEQGAHIAGILNKISEELASRPAALTEENDSAAETDASDIGSFVTESEDGHDGGESL
ncbi:MAG: 30S ribosome-binding factor RbfA [Oscillospiraceae bacterium]|nr:MAG: 30S ribosome-binding factor RbfA [Oscillospiraceae bacterium]